MIKTHGKGLFSVSERNKLGGWDMVKDYRGSYGRYYHDSVEDARKFVEHLKKVKKRILLREKEDEEFIRNNPPIYL